MTNQLASTPIYGLLMTLHPPVQKSQKFFRRQILKHDNNPIPGIH